MSTTGHTASASLTRKQIDGLKRIRDRGSLAWSEGIRSRAGGATRRMFERLAAIGLCTSCPFEITDKGREALTDDQESGL
jgi:hypothetical protein